MAIDAPNPVTITVDAARASGPLKRIWRSIGYDELNWTYTQTGKRIFAEIAALGDGPFWVRNHNIFSSGNLRSSPYKASTNCFRMGPDGEPEYDWTTVDRVYDVYVANGCKPMVELDFMPHHLSAFPQSDAYDSGRYPPRDFHQWRELNRQFALHLIDRYGRDEVRAWYFASWNEPDGCSWLRLDPIGDPTDPAWEAERRKVFLKMHDHAVDGILAADERLRVGGPDIAHHAGFLEMFLEHCDSGTNFATGRTGTRLDFISLHTKGTGKRGTRVPNPDFDLVARRELLRYDQVIRKFPRFRDLPLLCNEWDIDVWSPGGIYDSPDFRFRNTSYYPVFLIRSVKELLDLMTREQINLELITQWTFYFHGMRCFEGTRAIFDPLGIRKPVFNGFEMLAKLGDERIALATDDTVKDIRPGEEAGTRGARCPRDDADAAELGPERSIRPCPSVDGLAARDGDSTQILVWNQVCDQYAKGARDIRVRVVGQGAARQVRVTEYRIDAHHSNAHTIWEQLGCPDWPDDAQIEAMRAGEELETVRQNDVLGVNDGVTELRLTLPMHAVSLLVLERL
jgi:xylan 1,4-beta-xylosidase